MFKKIRQFLWQTEQEWLEAKALQKYLDEEAAKLDTRTHEGIMDEIYEKIKTDLDLKKRKFDKEWDEEIHPQRKARPSPEKALTFASWPNVTPEEIESFKKRWWNKAPHLNSDNKPRVFKWTDPYMIIPIYDDFEFVLRLHPPGSRTGKIYEGIYNIIVECIRRYRRFKNWAVPRIIKYWSYLKKNYSFFQKLEDIFILFVKFIKRIWSKFKSLLYLALKFIWFSIKYFSIKFAKLFYKYVLAPTVVRWYLYLKYLYLKYIYLPYMEHLYYPYLWPYIIGPYKRNEFVIVTTAAIASLIFGFVYAPTYFQVFSVIEPRMFGVTTVGWDQFWAQAIPETQPYVMYEISDVPKYSEYYSKYFIDLKSFNEDHIIPELDLPHSLQQKLYKAFKILKEVYSMDLSQEYKRYLHAANTSTAMLSQGKAPYNSDTSETLLLASVNQSRFRREHPNYNILLQALDLLCNNKGTFGGVEATYSDICKFFMQSGIEQGQVKNSTLGAKYLMLNLEKFCPELKELVSQYGITYDQLIRAFCYSMFQDSTHYRLLPIQTYLEIEAYCWAVFDKVQFDRDEWFFFIMEVDKVQAYLDVVASQPDMQDYGPIPPRHLFYPKDDGTREAWIFQNHRGYSTPYGDAKRADRYYRASDVYTTQRDFKLRPPRVLRNDADGPELTEMIMLLQPHERDFYGYIIVLKNRDQERRYNRFQVDREKIRFVKFWGGHSETGGLWVYDEKVGIRDRRYHIIATMRELLNRKACTRHMMAEYGIIKNSTPIKWAAPHTSVVQPVNKIYLDVGNLSKKNGIVPWLAYLRKYLIRKRVAWRKVGKNPSIRYMKNKHYGFNNLKHDFKSPFVSPNSPNLGPGPSKPIKRFHNIRRFIRLWLTRRRGAYRAYKYNSYLYHTLLPTTTIITPRSQLRKHFHIYRRLFTYDHRHVRGKKRATRDYLQAHYANLIHELKFNILSPQRIKQVKYMINYSKRKKLYWKI